MSAGGQAAASAIGSTIGAIYGERMAGERQEDSQAFTREQMQNRHQWQVADMRAAGLNPLLSAGSAPSMGGSGIATAQNYGATLGQSMSNFAGAEKMNTEIQNIIQDTVLKQTGQTVNQANAQRLFAMAEQVKMQTNLTGEDFKKAAYQNTYNKIEANLFANHEWMGELKAMGIDGSTAVDVLRSLIGTLHFGKGRLVLPNKQIIDSLRGK